jgi:CBS domain-containing protein
MRVDQLMTKNVITVTPETPLRDVAALLAEKGISGVPVVENDQLLGVVSEADLLVKEAGPGVRPSRVLDWLLLPDYTEREAKFAARTAGEAMTSPAQTIPDYASVATAAARMSEERVNRLPVLKDGKLVGILTRADVIRAFTRRDDEIAEEIREDVIGRGFWEPPDAVTVEVDQGEVVLSGTVQSHAVASGIPRAVLRVPGVVSVESRLTAAQGEGK